MNTDISALAIDPATPRILYAASHTQGIYKSINGGGSWSVINNGLPFIKVITSLAIDPLTPTTLYAGTGSSGIYKSTNGGGNWTEVNTGLNIAFEYYISVLAIDPSTPATLYAGTADGVVRSTNGGGNWINIGLADKDVNALVIDPAAPGTLYAGTYMEGVYKSTNGGGDWNPVNNGLTDDLVYALAINPVTPATLYAGTDMGGVFKSTDSGDNWYPVNTGLPPYPGFPDDYLTVNSLVIDPLLPTTLYAGLGLDPGATTYPNLAGGVFKSTDGGETWNTVGNGLTDYPINALAINHAAQADLYAAIDGGGIAALNNIIIHPSILTFKSTGAQDGRILESAENSNKGGTMNTTAPTLVLGDNAQKKQYRSILSFNTKGLPDNATITKITLKVKKQGVVGGGNPVNTFQGFMVDLKKGYFGSAPGLQASDFQAGADKSYGPFKPALSNGWYTINLTPAKAYINKLTTGGGLTQIRLRFKLEDNNNAVANDLSLYSGNAPAASRPQLIVEYSVP
jgi:photosystem II stability/assembly factor-like uncharacterized protein